MKKIILLIIIHYSLLTAVCFSQQSITWQRVYGSAMGTEYFYSVVQVPDSGFIAVGAKSGGYILRTNKFGDTLWTKIYPGTLFSLILQTGDNIFVLTGSGILLLKMDINGGILWSKPKYNNSTYTYKFKETIDKGYVLVGYLDSGYYFYPYMIKVDSVGNYLWSKTFVNMPNADFLDIVPVGSSNYAISGDDTLSKFVMKTDQAGNILWLKHYSNTTGGNCIALLSDKGFAIAGGDNLVRTDSLGNLKWVKYYGFSNHPADIRSMINTNDGGFALTGEVDTLGNLNYFMHLIKTDSFGNIQWYKYFGSDNYDVGYCVRQTIDKGYVIAGLKDSLFAGTHSYLIKTDSGGFANPIAIRINSRVIGNFIVEQNYPNPFNSTTNIKFDIPRSTYVEFRIYDILGRQAYFLKKYYLKGTHKITLQGLSFASGIYFYSIKINDIIVSHKMVYLK